MIKYVVTLMCTITTCGLWASEPIPFVEGAKQGGKGAFSIADPKQIAGLIAMWFAPEAAHSCLAVQSSYKVLGALYDKKHIDGNTFVQDRWWGDERSNFLNGFTLGNAVYLASRFMVLLSVQAVRVFLDTMQQVVNDQPGEMVVVDGRMQKLMVYSLISFLLPIAMRGLASLSRSMNEQSIAS